MEINTNKPVSNSVQGIENTQKISAVNREKEETPDQQATRTEDNPDFRINLSDTSKNKVSELTGGQSSGHVEGTTDLSEEEAVRMAQQASEQLAQTKATISNQAIQQAVDLFT